MPAEVGWLHTLGSVTLALLAVLTLTGVLLTLNYSPSTEHAYHSVRYIENEVPLGSLVRGLHHWAASFVVVAIALHLLHAFVHFAFVRPRELTWCTGVALLLIVLAFGFTGYLLPWDEKAYWATVVGTSMARQVPGAGESLLYLLRGGAEVGAAALSRFYGAHITLLPVLLALLVGVHLYLVVLHGISRDGEGRARRRRRAGANARDGSVDGRAEESRSVPFWPDVLAMDATAVFLVLALLFFIALQVGAPLEAPADPTNTEYTPRPDWYFLPLFKLLTFFPGSAESIAALGLPLLMATALLSLPWWGRSLVRSARGRTSLLGGAGLAFTSVIALGVAGARASPRGLAPPPPAVARGRLLFDQLGCLNCHTIRGIGGIVGPDLTVVGLRRPDFGWLADHLRDPRSIVPATPMPAFPLQGESLSDLVAFLLSLGNDVRYSALAPELYRKNCSACHRLGGQGGTYGPDLGRVGRLRTVAYIHQYTEDPSSLNRDARMPAAVNLTHEQVEDVSRYVVATARGAQGGVRPERPSPDSTGGPEE